MGHTYARILYHVVFSTKGRRPLITPDIRERLHAYVGGIVRELKATALAVNGTADHIHLLIETRPSTALSDLVRIIKANSSKWIHETFPQERRFAWQSGYAVFSVSESLKEKVVSYIRHQEEHHAKHHFDEEFKLFLERHGLVLDHRDMLDGWDAG